MPQFKVVTYVTRRYETVVEGGNETEALMQADAMDPADMDEDNEYFKMNSQVEELSNA